MTAARAWLALLAACAAGAPAAAAQGYRLRLDTRVETVAYRGVTQDSIPAADAVAGPTGGLVTPDGIAVTCFGTVCRYFRPGPTLRATPLVARADLLLWGLGVPGLTVRANGRYAADLAPADVWQGATPAFQLIEGYAQYERGWIEARAGRQLGTGRLGLYGFDGARLALRVPGPNVEVAAYGGWGLARGTVLPVTSPALNPLDDFQPRDRQIVAGGEVDWRSDLVDLRGEYRREVDPATDYFVSERAALSAALRPVPRVLLVAAGDWDLAMGQLGSVEARGSYLAPFGSATIGFRRYRPFFDLWTIWGAFSPVSHDAVTGAVTVRPGGGVTLRARGERYRYDDAEADTPLASVEDEGWRWSMGGAWSLGTRWTLDAGIHAESGPGAASRGWEGRVDYRPTDRIALALAGGRMERPLELRFSESDLSWIGLEAEVSPSDRLRVALRAARYDEARERPDAAGFDWDQLRVSARVSLLLRSDADRAWLPPPLGPRGGRDR